MEWQFMSMKNRFPLIACRLTILLFALVSSGQVLASSVLIHTTLGDVEVELFDQAAPATVANFLQYVNAGAYANTFIHRKVSGFIVQGGGFTFIDGAVEAIPKNPRVINEPGISNTRGTIAMAKLQNDENSATSQWYINLADNSSQLDATNGGYTVFGQVVGDGMDVIDAIAALQVWAFNPPFQELPLIDFANTGPPILENFVMTDIESINRFSINPGLNDAWFNQDTNGQGFFIVVYPDVKTMFLSWFTFEVERPDESVPANLGEAGHRWITAQGSYSGNQAELDVYISRGGVFDQGTPVPEATPDGTMTVEFDNCSEGSVSFDIPSINQQGVIQIKRVADDNISFCEELAEQVSQ
jgi:peptidyl-prolyl cis-trans isomerase A (cyclophilin A)